MELMDLADTEEHLAILQRLGNDTGIISLLNKPGFSVEQMQTGAIVLARGIQEDFNWVYQADFTSEQMDFIASCIYNGLDAKLLQRVYRVGYDTVQMRTGYSILDCSEECCFFESVYKKEYSAIAMSTLARMLRNGLKVDEIDKIVSQGFSDLEIALVGNLYEDTKDLEKAINIKAR